MDTPGTPPAPAIRRQIGYPDAQPIAGSGAHPLADSSSGEASALVRTAQVVWGVAGSLPGLTFHFVLVLPLHDLPHHRSPATRTD